MTIDTLSLSESMRRKTIDLDQRKILITDFSGTEQQSDDPEHINCGGLGRVRTFRRQTSSGWPANPLPIDPAAARLGLVAAESMSAQVFQSASCNWRCWYCYVPFTLLAGNTKYAAWKTASELLDLFEREPDAARIIDLSGGQPELTPEWVVWTMQELKRRGLDRRVYLWSDDNLSTDYYWRFLSKADIQLVTGYRNYGKVCCFKGFNAASFVYNTAAAWEDFTRQFAIFERYVKNGIDLYGYATFTSSTDARIAQDMADFVDRLQHIHPQAPLRIVPLEVQKYGAVARRVGDRFDRAIEVQWIAIDCWKAELAKRFSGAERQLPIHQVALNLSRAF